MRADARANREAIILGATHQIAAHGADVPFSAIAEDAGVGIATLYRNFPTREELVLAVLESFRDRALEIVERYRPLVDRDPAAGWEAFARALADLHPGALVTAFSREFVTGDGLSEYLQTQRADLLGAVQDLIDRAARAGVVRRDLTATEFQMGIALITRPLPDVAVPDLAEHQAWLIDVYLQGLRA